MKLFTLLCKKMNLATLQFWFWNWIFMLGKEETSEHSLWIFKRPNLICTLVKFDLMIVQDYASFSQCSLTVVLPWCATLRVTVLLSSSTRGHVRHGVIILSISNHKWATGCKNMKIMKNVLAFFWKNLDFFIKFNEVDLIQDWQNQFLPRI